VIPTVYRDNYLSALTAMSNLAGGGEALVSVLDFSRAWVMSIDWSTWASSISGLEATYAQMESRVAEQSGLRLRLRPAVQSS
jgi:hypothetical protein